VKLILGSSEGGITRLDCEGPISGGMSGENPLEQVMGMGCYNSQTLLNLVKATTINSTGVAWLVRCHKNFEQNGGMLVLHSIPPAIDHVLRLLNMNALLHIASTEEKALTLVEGKTA
jgi:anti-anti-sigma regulatory factor